MTNKNPLATQTVESADDLANSILAELSDDDKSSAIDSTATIITPATPDADTDAELTVTDDAVSDAVDQEITALMADAEAEAEEAAQTDDESKEVATFDKNAPVAKPSKSSKKKATTKKAPRVDTGEPMMEIIAKLVSDNSADETILSLDKAPGSLTDRVAEVNSVNSKEKISLTNMVKHVTAGSSLNKFQQLALEHLSKNGNKMTIKSLSEYLQSGHKNGHKSYTKGTAMAQAAVFCSFCRKSRVLLKNDQNEYSPNESSPIWIAIQNKRQQAAVAA